jgi:hypothetical protein
MTTQIISLALRVALLTIPGVGSVSDPIFASGVVGTGTPASCSEAALRRIMR